MPSPATSAKFVEPWETGPVPSAVTAYFKDREEALHILREQLATESLRLLLVCGRSGVGTTALITKFLLDLQRDFTLRPGDLSTTVESIVYVVLRQSEFRSPDKIVELIGRTLEPKAAAALRAKWQEQAPPTDKYEFLFRRLFGTRPCLIVLDNFEDVLDADNHIRDEYGDLRTDDSGFALDPTMPYAGQEPQRVIELPARQYGRLQGRGVMKRQNDLQPWMFAGSRHTGVVIACVDAFCHTLTKKTVVGIDHASLQTRAALADKLPDWRKKGLIVQYLPPYAPELNLLESLWRRIQYTWLPFSASECLNAFSEALATILSHVGSEYQITFA
jgi:hypothetical protein